MNGILSAAAGFALDVALKATAVFLITALAVAALKRSGAAARHFVGMAGLIGAIALPFLTLALPRVELPLLPPLIVRAESAPRRLEPARANEKSASLSEETSLPGPEQVKIARVSDSASAPRQAGPATAKRFDWLPLALGAWALGLFL